MSCQIKWYVENRVVLCEVADVLTLEEIQELSASITSRIRAGHSPVHVIVDPSRIEKYPVNIAAIKAVVQKPEPKAGWVILISTNPVIRFIMTMVVQMSGAKFRVTPTLEEALLLLQRIDLTLGQLVPESSDGLE